MNKLMLYPINAACRFFEFHNEISKKILNRLGRDKYFLEFDWRDDDIYIVSFPKSGTTLMQMLMHQLTSDGNMNFNHIYEVSPFLEHSINTHQSLKDFLSPRIIKTHLQYSIIPKNCPGKFIYVMRHGMDVSVSLYHQHRNVYPGYGGRFNEYFDKIFMAEFGMSWFKHVAGWCKNKNNRNILYLKYEDLLSNLDVCIKQIIAFCKIEVKESELPRIKERCHIDFMRKYEEKFDMTPVIKLTKFIRNGKTKEGEKHLKDYQKEMYAKRFNKYLNGFGIESYKK